MSSPATSSSSADELRTGRRRLGAKVAWAVAMTLALLVVVVVAVITLGTLVPGLGLLSNVGNLLAGTFSPHFAIVALVVGAVGVLAWRGGIRRSGRIAAVLGAGTMIANVAIVSVLVGAISANGGTVDLAKATFGLSDIAAPAPDDVRAYDTTDSGEELTVDIFEPKEGSDERTPAILYVHGGGWSQGSGTTTAADHRDVADAGYTVVSVNYELSTPGNPTWDKAPAQVACAAVWLADHADELGIDMDRLAFWGDSAGGNLALNAAYSAAQGTAQSSCGGTVPAPTAVVVDYPAADVRGVTASGFSVDPLNTAELSELYLGGSPEEFPERYDAVSTATYLSPQAPPTLIIEPTRDTLVPTQTVYDFAEEARASGVDVQLAEIPLSWHIYTQLAHNAIADQGHITIGLNYLEGRWA